MFIYIYMYIYIHHSAALSQTDLLMRTKANTSDSSESKINNLSAAVQGYRK